mgnify:CR=1 FL=1
MFGYIKLNKPESKIREYEYYRAVYCGLCRSLGKCTGQCSRLMLSYDMTFMALVRLALEEVKPTVGRGRCIAHPFRRRPMVKPPRGSREQEIFSLCACATVLLSYHKLCDDIADERGMRRLRAVLVKPLIAPLRRRAVKRFGSLEAVIRQRLAELSALEKSDGTSMDAPAEIFGKLLADVLSYGLEGAAKRIAAEIGFHIGKWVYLVDAADDHEEDVRKGRYNPLTRAYGEKLDSQAREALLTALIAELCEAERGFDLLNYPEGDLEAIVKNIIYLGMPQTAEAVLIPCGEKGAEHERPL